MPDFLPRRSADLLRWSSNFDQAISAAPQAFGLSSEQAAQYAQRHAALEAAAALANAPVTRTAGNIVARQEAESSVKQYARILAAIVRANGDVDDPQRIALGLRAAKSRGMRIPPPARQPVIFARQAGGRAFEIRLADPESPERRRKPAGVVRAAVFTFIGEQPPQTLDGWSLRAEVSRTTFVLPLPGSIPPGTKLWITACWFNPRGEKGPIATPICMHIGGGVSKAG